MNKKIFSLLVFIIATFCVSGNSAEKYLGQWTLDIEGGMVGWLEVKQADGYLDGDLLWKWGSVTPVASVFMMDEDNLIVTRSNSIIRERDENMEPVKTHIMPVIAQIKLVDGKLKGVFIEPKADGSGSVITNFEGTKLPALVNAPDLKKVKYGDPVELFNGKDLSGWKLTSENQTNGFKVVDGVLVNDPVRKPGVSYGNLQTEKEFEDFRLTLEVNVPAHSNSGIYLRGMYEIQVVDSYGMDLDSHNMGGLYSRITPAVAAEKPGGEWQTMDIILCDRHVTVVLNGKTVIDNKPAYGPTGGALTSDVFAPGPLYLQGDHGKVSYRNIVLTPILK